MQIPALDDPGVALKYLVASGASGMVLKVSRKLYSFSHIARWEEAPGERVLSGPGCSLGYCWMHHFKCHSARSCRTWAKGGPITKDEVSLDWQERND